jgi:hypothetical protein
MIFFTTVLGKACQGHVGIIVFFHCTTKIQINQSKMVGFNLWCDPSWVIRQKTDQIRGSRITFSQKTRITGTDTDHDPRIILIRGS